MVTLMVQLTLSMAGKDSWGKPEGEIDISVLPTPQCDRHLPVPQTWVSCSVYFFWVRGESRAQQGAGQRLIVKTMSGVATGTGKQRMS